MEDNKRDEDTKKEKEDQGEVQGVKEKDVEEGEDEDDRVGGDKG